MILVTGATGFVGRHLVSSLLNDGASIYAVTRRQGVLPSANSSIKIIMADIAERIDIPPDVTTIYHCAGVIENKNYMAKVNIQGTANIADAALRIGCKLIHLSSAGVIGNNSSQLIDEGSLCKPKNLYEKTKYEAERTLAKFVSKGLKVCILRPTIIFGAGKSPSNDSFLQLISAIKVGRYMHIGKGQGIYNIVHVSEVVRALRVLEDNSIPNGQIFFINNPIYFADIVDVVKHAGYGKDKTVYNIPYPLGFCVAVLFSIVSKLTGKRMPFTFSRLKALANKQTFSQNRLLENTRYRPLKSIKEYIFETCLEYHKQGFLN